MESSLKRRLDDEENSDSDDGLKKRRPSRRFSVKDRIEVLFLEIDKSKNGWVDLDELKDFITELGVSMSEDESLELMNIIDKDHNKTINFEEFFDYTLNLLQTAQMKDQTSKEEVDGSAKKSYTSRWKQLKEQYIANQTKENKRLATLHIITKELQKMHALSPQIGINKLVEKNKHLQQATKNNIKRFEERLLEELDLIESKELGKFIADRWKGFIDFKRQGSDGGVVLTSDDNATDALPGDYDLVYLVMTQFRDINDAKIPRHAVIKEAKWNSAKPEGRLICNEDWNGHVPVDIGTNQFLSYYGACLASDKEEKVALLQRHGTVDFNYENNYHDNYVIKTLGGNGIEKHSFHHMDCPLEDDSGFFILGKFVENDLHLTAFKIPINHVLYIPPNTIHSNDHLLGRWRTMLSDAKDAPVDHVLITKQSTNGETKPVDIKFDISIAHFHEESEKVFCSSCKKFYKKGEEKEEISEK